MKVHRLEKYNLISASSLISKSFFYVNARVSFAELTLVAGLYKPSSVALEHALILSSLTGTLPMNRQQLHGKRQKRTTSFTAILTRGKIWPAFDKLLNEVLPRVADLKSLKFSRSLWGSCSIRIKNKLLALIDFEDLMSASLLDSNKGVFLPLSVHCNLKSRHRFLSEVYLRMLKLPITFYNNRPAPAFDDPIKFS